MTTKKQKITAVLALAIAFGLGMAVMCGCSYFTQEKVAEIHKTVGTILDIATPPAELFLSNRRSTSSSPTARSRLSREKCSRKPHGVLTRLCRQNLRSFQSKTWPSKFPSKDEARLGASFPAGLFVSAEMDNTCGQCISAISSRGEEVWLKN